MRSGARDVDTGIEPLYAWLRLSVTHVAELKAPEQCSFIVHIGNVNNARHRVINLTAYPDLAHYQRELTAEKHTEEGRSGCGSVEDDGRIRLVALPVAPGAHAFLYREPCPLNEWMICGSKEYYLRIPAEDPNTTARCRARPMRPTPLTMIRAVKG